MRPCVTTTLETLAQPLADLTDLEENLRRMLRMKLMRKTLRMPRVDQRDSLISQPTEAEPLDLLDSMPILEEELDSVADQLEAELPPQQPQLEPEATADLFQDNLAPEPPDNSAEMFPSSPADQFQDNSVPLPRDNSVHLYLDNSADRSPSRHPDNNAEVFQDRAADLFQDKPVPQFLSKSVD